MRLYIFKRPVAPGTRAIQKVEVVAHKYGQAVSLLVDTVGTIPAGSFAFDSYPLSERFGQNRVRSIKREGDA